MEWHRHSLNQREKLSSARNNKEKSKDFKTSSLSIRKRSPFIDKWRRSDAVTIKSQRMSVTAKESSQKAFMIIMEEEGYVRRRISDGLSDHSNSSKVTIESLTFLPVSKKKKCNEQLCHCQSWMLPLYLCNVLHNNTTLAMISLLSRLTNLLIRLSYREVQSSTFKSIDSQFKIDRLENLFFKG